MEFFHASTLGGQLGVYATTHTLVLVVWWKGLTKDIREYVRNCSICQKIEPKNVAYPVKMLPLPIPEGVFIDVTMNSIDGLPKSQGKTTIIVVVDHLTKYAHFAALPHPYTAQSVAKLFLEIVYKLHGFLNTVTSDKDPNFTSTFWQELFQLQGVSLQLSLAYHPQTNGQTKLVNRCV